MFEAVTNKLQYVFSGILHLNVVVDPPTHIAAAFVRAVIAACAISFYFKDALRGFKSMGDLNVSRYYGSLLDMQRDSATDVEYEQALRDYLRRHVTIS